MSKVLAINARKKTPIRFNKQLGRNEKCACGSGKKNKQYFEARPLILSDRTGELVIIAGNQRFKAAKELKLKKAPTYLITGLTEAKEREIIIRDNVSNGEWDFDILANDWDAKHLEDWGLDTPVFTKDSDEFGTDFTLKSGDKEPFQQMTFTLADEQAVQIQNAISEIKQTDEYKFAETMGNENSNLFLLPNGSKIHSMTIKSSKTLINKYGNWKKYLDTEHNGWKKIKGFQLRYIYLIDKTCKITVPILPFSKIDEMGAGMYKGKKVSLQSRKEICVDGLNKSRLASSQEMAVTPTSTLQLKQQQNSNAI